MLFTEPAFLFYLLPVLLLLHLVVGRQLRNPILLVASLLFYAWGEPAYVLVLLVSIAFNYCAGLVASRRGGWLAVGLAGNLAILGSFKYLAFIAENLSLLLESVGLPRVEVQPIALPIGISFYTFQAMSYLVDVGRGEARPQRNPIHLALYISMFPQLIAGPIVRYSDIEDQLRNRRVSRAGFAEGIRRFVIGLGKKMLLANTLALPADRIFALPQDSLTAGLSWLAVVCYTLQIYFDFSGYSDMAIGLGKMFGFHFKENFDHPYVSTSLREFWRRWHISLSTWFRDYVYIPLGGGRRSRVRVYFNLWFVFLLCGAWHGASWNFVLWGAWHGLFLAIERALSISPRASGLALPRRIYTLGVVMLGWVIFRTDSLSEASATLLAMVGQGHGDGVAWNVGAFLDAQVLLGLAAALIASTPLPLRVLTRWLPKSPGLGQGLASALEIAGLAAIFVGCCALVAGDTYNPFIYFRF